MSSPVDKTEGSDKNLIQQIQAGNKQAFEKLFYSYYRDLCGLAYKITECPEHARDVVQDVFFKLWKKRGSWDITLSLKAYLYQAVWNQALNNKDKTANHRKLRQEFSRVKDTKPQTVSATDTDDRTQRLLQEIWSIVDAMAERRKYVFILHRRHGLSYKEIADVMNVTRKTVENHMGLALKEIRESVNADLLRP